MPALRASSQHNEWHLQGLFRRAGTMFCHSFGTCVPWQGPGGERAQNDRSGREELGRAGPIKGKIILKKTLKNSTNSCTSSSFCFPAQVCTRSGVSPWPLGSTHPLSSSERAFQGREGQSKSSHIARTSCCQGNSSLGNGRNILGIFSAPHHFVSPQPQVTKSSPGAQTTGYKAKCSRANAEQARW